MVVESLFSLRSAARATARVAAVAMIGALGLAATAVTPASAVEDPPAVPATWSVKPASRAAHRLLGDDALERFLFVAEQPSAQGEEHFRISAKGGRVVIGGTSPAVILRGLGTYLGQQGMDISWTGEQIADAPEDFALPTTTTYTKADVAHRFALNDTDDGYTGAYRTWPDWQRTIDVLALKGINEVFMPVGAEAVYLDTFSKFGYTEEELLKWIPQPAHQPWWLLQNMSSFPSPISKRMVEDRAKLGAKISERMRELGITPVLPGYFGTVPPEFAARNPGASTVPQGGWVGFTRPDWLDPTKAPFPAVAKAFYDSSQRRFGASTMYKMDLLHEGGQAGKVNVGDASKAVEAALQQAHPGAIWAILGWQNNPRPETLAAIDTSKMFIVDGLADRYNNMDRERDWQGTKYAFGSIWNFGGHTTMGANIGVWNERYWQWKAKSNSALDGIAVLPEGSDNNPLALDFLASMAWTDRPANLPQWYADWADRRYGKGDPNAQRAWQTIGATAYAMPSGSWSEAQDGLFADQPSLDATSAASWSPGAMRYSASAFAAALPAMLDVDKSRRSSSAYTYDLVDVSRQVLSNHSRELLPRIKAAYTAKDRATFKKLTEQWLEEMRLLDELTGTQEQTMLGPWLEDIKQWDRAGEQLANRTYDARSLLTIWAHRSGFNAGLGDYANREWNGLISTYYLPRWQKYFTELDTALAEGRAPKAIDWFAFGDEWSKGAGGPVATKPRGDAHVIASKVLAYLKAHPSPLTVTATAKAGVVTATAPDVVTVKLDNPNPYSTLDGITVDVKPGAGLAVKPLTPAPTSIAPGGSATATFEVSLVPGAEPAIVTPVTVTANSALAGASAPATVQLMTAGPPVAPNRTVSFNSAAFAQRGDEYAIVGGGADLWGSTNQFGSIYRPDALASGQQVTTKVTSLERTGPWARAGIMVRNDMPNQSSRGFLNLAITPDHGCVLSYDSNNDGRLETYKNVDSIKAPVSLRLSRNGNSFTGECSADGRTWVSVGSATVTADASADVGLFMTAASSQRGLARFEGFSISGATAPEPPAAGTTYLSDLPFLSSTGGHGPWERDQHNGETAPGDGGPIVLSGKTYAKGLGTNANAEASFNLGGKCTKVAATVGIDDSMNKADADGDVVFRVFGDGRSLYDSGVVRAGDPRMLDVDVTGVRTLRLVVDQYDSNNWWDRADWADAKVTCT